MLCKHRNEFPQKKFKFIRIGRTPAEPISQIPIQIYLFRFSCDFGTNVVPSVFYVLNDFAGQYHVKTFVMKKFTPKRVRTVKIHEKFTRFTNNTKNSRIFVNFREL